MFAAYATDLGRALVDRELYLPKSWTGDADRCRAAKIPDERGFATKGTLALAIARRCIAAGLPAARVTATRPTRAFILVQRVAVPYICLSLLVLSERWAARRILHMLRVSLSMIVRDEEESLAAVLADARAFCDELVIADTGSTDCSREVAARAGATVLDVPWADDFAEARNACLSACTGDWVVWLDADDRVGPTAQRAFAAVLSRADDQVDVMTGPYRYAFDPVTGECTFTVLRERVLRRAAAPQWQGAVHEAVDVSTLRVREEPTLVVDHRRTKAQEARHQGRNLRILQRLYARGDRSPRTLYYLGNELRDNARPAEAAEAYRAALQAGIAGWERYFSLLSLAEALMGTGHCAPALEAAQEAARLDPGRPEAWVVAGRIPYQSGHWEKAIPFFERATAARSRPMAGFVREADYGWLPWDLLSVCLGNSGRFTDALQAARQALNGNPEPLRVRSNIDWFVRNLSTPLS